MLSSPCFLSVPTCPFVCAKGLRAQAGPSGGTSPLVWGSERWVCCGLNGHPSDLPTHARHGHRPTANHSGERKCSASGTAAWGPELPRVHPGGSVRCSAGASGLRGERRGSTVRVPCNSGEELRIPGGQGCDRQLSPSRQGHAPAGCELAVATSQEEGERGLSPKSLRCCPKHHHLPAAPAS